MGERKMLPELRPEQEKLIENIRSSVRAGNKRIAAAAPCAFGKTVTFCHIAKRSIENGKRVWIVVDSIELIDQTLAELKNYGLDSGVIQGIHELTDYTKPLQVVTAQTITRRWQRFDANPQWLPDIAIFDENHTVYKAHRELINMLPKTLVIGFSATPTTKWLGKLYSDLVVGSTVKELLDMGRLSPVRAFACHEPDLKGIATGADGDYAKKPLTERVNTKTIRADIVKTWFRLGENRQTIVFTILVQHSIDVANEFADAGIKVAQIDGRTNKDLRKQIIEDFKNGVYKMLVSVGTIIKGFNATGVECIIDAQPTKSLSRHIQKLGRGMRLHEGKKDCLILDHASNILRNGWPQDYHPTELDNGEKKENPDRKKETDPKPKKCANCGAIIDSFRCSNCGHEIEKQAGIIVEPGELKELTPTQKKNIKNSTPESQQAFYSGLIAYGQDKGYKPGYAAHKFKSKFGVFPDNLQHVPGDYSFGEVASYIKYLNIKAAHAGRRF